MVSRTLIIVFVLPAVFTIMFGVAVMYEIRETLDRTLHLWPLSALPGPDPADGAEGHAAIWAGAGGMRAVPTHAIK